MGFTSFVSGLGKGFVSACSRVTSGSGGKVAVAAAVVTTALLVGGYAYNHFSGQQKGVEEPRIEELREAETTLPDSVGSVGAEEYTPPGAETVKLKETTSSFEDQDYDILYDKSLNPIRGTCFEIGSALSILETPGAAGERMDVSAMQLSAVITRIYTTDLGDKIVTFNGQPKTLRQIFDEKLLREIRPSSDQIGRCPDKNLEETWFNGAGVHWLQQQLQLSSKHRNYSQHNMLTKIRMLSALGTVIRDLMISNEAEAVAAFLKKDSAAPVIQRYNTVVEKIRHGDFDSPVTRARSERPPIIDGQSVGQRLLQSAGPLGLGFGQVYGQESFRDDRELYARYLAEEKAKGGRQGLKRENQPIDDPGRPGNISEHGLQKMPEAFKDAGLPQLLNEKAFVHGTGVNRWQVHGTHSKTGWVNGFPAAGAHSGGTVDVLLALDCLNETTICGDQETVLQSGLLISSFMNFGGYHSFNETFPIAQAFAKGETFEVIDPSRQAERLYDEFAVTATKHCPDAVARIQKFRTAYDDSLRQAKIRKKISDTPKIHKAKTVATRSWEILP